MVKPQSLAAVHTARKSRPILRPLADTRAGEKLKKRLEQADSLIASGSHPRNDLRPAKPVSKRRVKADTADTADTTDLHRDQGSRPQDSSVAPVQQHCKEEPSDALLPAADSLLPTSGGAAGGTAQNTDPPLSPFDPSTPVAVGLATPFTVEYLPSNIGYINDGSSPFDEGYLAMNGPWMAAQHRYL